MLLALVILSSILAFARPAAVTAATTDPGLQDLVAERVQVVESKTIFTLFAFMNVAGFDAENGSTGMHPVRLRIRSELERRVPAQEKERFRDFYRLHAASADPYDYGVVAMCTSGPPDFAFDKEWSEVSRDSAFAALSGVAGLLRTFWGSGVPDSLYGLVLPDYVSAVESHREVILRQVSRVMEYCRVRSDSELTGGGEVARMVVVPNLMGSYDSAFSFVLSDVFYAIEGPQHSIGYNPHEFVHSITNRVSYDPRYAELQSRAMPLFDAARTVAAIREEFSSLAAFFDENLVRAIALRYLDTGDPTRSRALEQSVLKEYRAGYTLERYFFDSLAGYEESGEPLQAYYPSMLMHLDVVQELSRWEAERRQR